jgi:nucleotide-binding universal stress UspA family protein
MAKIVVGVDGSEHARRAVAWAVEEAKLRGADLELVHATIERDLPAWPAQASVPSHDELMAAARELVDEAVESVDTSDVAVESSTGSGSPARRLCEAAEGADLLVVGARGLGGFRGLLMGSVSQQVVQHAPCPVVVVVPERR